jgi:hypothetical protein
MDDAAVCAAPDAVVAFVVDATTGVTVVVVMAAATAGTATVVVVAVVAVVVVANLVVVLSPSAFGDDSIEMYRVCGTNNANRTHPSRNVLYETLIYTKRKHWIFS